MRLIGLGLASLLVLAACGDPESVEPVGHVEVAAVYQRVEYYGACGNETLSVDGTTYYPIHNETYPGSNDDSQRPDTDRYPVVGELLGMVGSVVGSAGASPRVVPPGPGDDVGDLIVYVDGIARFESDSGWVIWLTDEQQTYGWEC